MPSITTLVPHRAGAARRRRSPRASPPASPTRCGCSPASGRSASSRPRTAARRSSPAGAATSPRRPATTSARSRRTRSSVAPRFDADARPARGAVERQPVDLPAGDAPGADGLRLGVETGPALPAAAARAGDVAGLRPGVHRARSPCGRCPTTDVAGLDAASAGVPPTRRRPRPRRSPPARRAGRRHGAARHRHARSRPATSPRCAPRRGVDGLGRRAVQPARSRRPSDLAARADGVRLLDRLPARRPTRSTSGRSPPAATTAAPSTGTASTATATSTSAPRRPRSATVVTQTVAAGAGDAARHAGAAVLGARGRPARPRRAAARRHRPAAAADDRHRSAATATTGTSSASTCPSGRWCAPARSSSPTRSARRRCCARTATRRRRRASAWSMFQLAMPFEDGADGVAMTNAFFLAAEPRPAARGPADRGGAAAARRAGQPGVGGRAPAREPAGAGGRRGRRRHRRRSDRRRRATRRAARTGWPATSRRTGSRCCPVRADPDSAEIRLARGAVLDLDGGRRRVVAAPPPCSATPTSRC